jgi:predicted O-linked N-acetylglucosamine transferase (SPINDLY family)
MIARLLKRMFGAAPERPGATADDVRLSQALQQGNRGDYAAAALLCRAVLAQQPDHPEALNLLSSALLAQGRAPEAIASLRRLTEIGPDSAQAWANLGMAQGANADVDGAIDSYRRALQLRVDCADAANNLALLFKALERYDEGEQVCRNARSDRPDAGLLHTLARILFEQGRVDEAIVEIRAALALNPDAPVMHSDLLRMLNYTQAQDPAAVWQEHRAWGLRHADPLQREAPTYDNVAEPLRPLRIGYVSPYFRRHAVTFFLESVIEHHDRERTQVVLYADVANPDDYSARLRSYGAAWRDTVGMSDAQLSSAIRQDAIDVLVDLSGHTPHHRLLAFARRPAPVQVTWNGYPNTTGMTGMDYRITDAYCDPPGTTEHLHSEKLVRLPEIFMTWRPPDRAPEVGPLPALATGHVTFASFNGCYKITPALVALWSRILDQVPGSRLMLLTLGSAVAAGRVRDLFARNGTDPQRLDILPRVTHDEFLSAHQRADIALDAFPYHGTTTTCFSLWMGLPVVVLAGACHASRVGVSMLSNLGLPQLIAHSGDEYVAVAVRLASDLPELARLRAGMRERMLRSPLTDGRGCARALESAFRQMWTAWCLERGAG